MGTFYWVIVNTQSGPYMNCSVQMDQSIGSAGQLAIIPKAAQSCIPVSGSLFFLSSQYTWDPSNSISTVNSKLNYLTEVRYPIHSKLFQTTFLCPCSDLIENEIECIMISHQPQMYLFIPVNLHEPIFFSSSSFVNL